MKDVGILFVRVALAASFLSAVADRFGLWGAPGDPGVAWGNYDNFLTYSGTVNSFVPQGLQGMLAATATILEIVLSVLLLTGYQTRIAAIGAAALTFSFAFAMAISFGIKTPLDYSVWVDFAAAFLLSTADRYRWSIDEAMKEFRK